MVVVVWWLLRALTSLHMTCACVPPRYLCHELRNPLLGVRGSLELLLLDHGESLPADAMQDVRAASRNAEVMHRVLDDVLDQRRIIAGTVDVRPRRSDVRVLLRDIGNQMRAYVAIVAGCAPLAACPAPHNGLLPPPGTSPPGPASSCVWTLWSPRPPWWM